MAIKTLTELKAYFEKGDFPTQQEFVDLIDTLASIPAQSSYNSEQFLIGGVASPTSGIVLSLTNGVMPKRADILIAGSSGGGDFKNYIRATIYFNTVQAPAYGLITSTYTVKSGGVWTTQYNSRATVQAGDHIKMLDFDDEPTRGFGLRISSYSATEIVYEVTTPPEVSGFMNGSPGGSMVVSY